MTTRTLETAPPTLIDPSSRLPRFGSYTGNLPPVDFHAVGASLVQRVARGKRWMYVIITSDEIVFCAAIVRLGYASNAFAFAIDRATGKRIVDITGMGPSLFAKIGTRASDGASATFHDHNKYLAILRPMGSKVYSIDIEGPGVKCKARLSAENAPPPLSVINKLPNGSFSTTEKGALLHVEGSLDAGGKHFDLKGAFGGYDYTAGLLERRTAWKWAFAMGKSIEGKPIAYNLTEGFVSDRECVAWIDGQVVPISAARFSFNPHRMMDPWKIRTESGACEVDFDASYLHREQHNLLVVKSSFQQVAGAFRGKLVLPNQAPVAFEKLPGVTEDQDTYW